MADIFDGAYVDLMIPQDLLKEDDIDDLLVDLCVTRGIISDAFSVVLLSDKNATAVLGEGLGGAVLQPDGVNIVLFINAEMPWLDIEMLLEHELTHVTQYLSGRLKCKDGIFTWEGDDYDYALIAAAQTGNNIREQQMAFPWEREAYEVQDAVMASYKV